MIHYHGTPIGSEKGTDRSKFYRNRHCCVSYARPDDLSIILEVASSYFVDNGAFSLWRSGKPVDWDGYMEWLDKLPRHPDFYLIPDVIGGSLDDNKRLIFHYGRKPGAVPVYHTNEPLEHLDSLIGLYPMVAIGSAAEHPVGSKIWWARMNEIMDVACDSDGRPRCKLHGLRQLAPAIFTKIPYHSCDSTNAGRNNNQIKRFGMYVPVDAAARAIVIADRIEAHNDKAHRQAERRPCAATG